MHKLAPDWTIDEWLNTDRPLERTDFTGKVVVLEAFQMLCPGCVSHGLPLAKKISETFRSEDVAVIGLHTVFEHHEAQGHKVALQAFLHEYRIRFPVGIDAQSAESRLPVTMSAYELQGTPSLILLDRTGQRRQQYFGAVDELVIGAELGRLILEDPQSLPSDENTDEYSSQGCRI